MLKTTTTKMKSFLTLTTSAASVPKFHTQNPSPILRFHKPPTTKFIIQFQPPNFLYPKKTSLINSILKNNNSYSKHSHSNQSYRGFCTGAPGSSSGEVHLIVGPMFAGKTTTLLKRMKSERSNGRSVAIIKSDKDVRYAVDSIVTHNGEKLPCMPLADLLSFQEKLGAEAYDKLEVIGIDEAQFFDDLYEFCCKAADLDGKTVIVAGLDGDYLRRRFGSVLDIIPIADTVTKLTAKCEVCGKRAFFTLRKTDETKTELIAGADVYMPVCRQHYVSGQVVKEATKAVLDSHNQQISSVL